MAAIFKKEVKGYFTSMIGYLFLACILLLEGIYFTAYHIQGAYPLFGVTLSSISFVFLILVPVFTMKTISEETKQKTDQMLLTAPLSVGQIVFGKYLALVAIYMIAILITCMYPLIMGKYGTISYPMAYTGIFGFFLLGAALLSIGLYMSSLTENPVIAAVLTFVALFFSYMIEGISSFLSDSSSVSLIIYMMIVGGVGIYINRVIQSFWIAAGMAGAGEVALLIFYIMDATKFESSVHKFLDIFNLVAHFENFTNGILDIQGMVYFLSVVVVFVFLTIQTISKRRWK